jgi:glycosyltransferase involved in cell wall biosynthesis
MPDRSVLTLAYHFPPLGGAGVQRMVQLARRLPDLGWEQVVITGPGGPESRWRPRDDSRPVGGPDVVTVRMDGPEPPHDVRWEGRLERWLRRPSRWTRWWSANVADLAASVDRRVDLVHASVAPYSTAESAVAVARRLGRPLLVDLEDPWALDETMVYPSRAHRALERRRMRRALAAADLVVMNTSEARSRVLQAFPELSPDSVLAIPNAFDPLDFADPGAWNGGHGRFRILHTGSLHTQMGLSLRSAGRARRALGGAATGVDMLTRSHVYLLEAVQRVLAADSSLEGVVEVHLAGVFSGEDRAIADRYPFVHLHDFVPHSETIAMLRSADVLFLPMHDLPAGRRAGLVPQKTYEYLAAGPPIVAAVPDGDARELLEAAGTARVCRPADVEAISAALRAELKRWRSGKPSPAPRADVLARCTADRLARDFAAAYETVAPTRAGGPA